MFSVKENIDNNLANASMMYSLLINMGFCYRNRSGQRVGCSVNHHFRKSLGSEHISLILAP